MSAAFPLSLITLIDISLVLYDRRFFPRGESSSAQDSDLGVLRCIHTAPDAKKFSEVGLVPAAGAEIQRKQANFDGESPFPLVDSAPERSRGGLT